LVSAILVSGSPTDPLEDRHMTHVAYVNIFVHDLERAIEPREVAATHA